MLKKIWHRLFTAATLTVVGAAAQAVNITGAGASFPFPIYAKWATEYHQQTGHQVNYQSIGSGGGQQQIIAGTVDFGASDDPMSAEQLEQADLLQFPAIIGGVVPVVNVRGIAPGALRLSGPVLADIFLGNITRWDDKRIKALNPELDLPARSIIVVHRSDGSGTTFVWSHYLAQVSPQWAEQVGVGKAIKWPTGQGGKGNEGVAAYVRQLNDSIGYVEFAYAVQNQLSWTQLDNQAGVFVQPDDSSFSAAAAHADWLATPGMGVILTHQKGEQSWPITAASFILVPKKQKQPEVGKAVLSFFDWAYQQGAELARELDYVPLPQEVVEQIRHAWAQELRTAEGQPIWP